MTGPSRGRAETRGLSPGSLPKASATAWEQNWGPYLSNKPQSIQAFVNDLISNPKHMYNSSADWPVNIEGGKLSNGQFTTGTYKTLQREFKDCNIQFP